MLTSGRVVLLDLMVLVVMDIILIDKLLRIVYDENIEQPSIVAI